MFLSYSGAATNPSSNLNLLFWIVLFFSLPRKAALCFLTVVAVRFYLWPYLDDFWVSLSTQTHMGFVNCANTLGNCHSKHLLLCMCWSLDRFSQLQFMCWVLGLAYCLFMVVFWAFSLQLIFSMCALEKTLVFQMRSSCWCCSFGCPGLDVLFCPGNPSDLGLEEHIRASLLSCILWRWENSQRQARAVPPPVHPGTYFRASSS